MNDTDLQHMRRCFELARQALPWCRPNPGVGCVLVRDGMVVGEGHTQVAGKEHAEIVALIAFMQRLGTDIKASNQQLSQKK